jgi:hypothetical protein
MCLGSPRSWCVASPQCVCRIPRRRASKPLGGVTRIPQCRASRPPGGVPRIPGVVRRNPWVPCVGSPVYRASKPLGVRRIPRVLCVETPGYVRRIPPCQASKPLPADQHAVSWHSWCASHPRLKTLGVAIPRAGHDALPRPPGHVVESLASTAPALGPGSSVCRIPRWRRTAAN